MATVRRAIITVAALAAAGALAVPAAQAGQVVWLASNARGGSQLWAANDDGTYPHRLIGAADAALASQLAAGTLGDPDVFQNAGATVLFTDATNTASPLCALPCARAFSLTAGVLADQSPAPAERRRGLREPAAPDRRRAASSSSTCSTRSATALDAGRAQRRGALPAHAGRERDRHQLVGHGDRDAPRARRPRP